MKRLIIVTVAAASLCMPALAQQNQRQKGPTAQNPQHQQVHAAGGNRSGSRIRPSQLGRSQIRQIQQALNDKGFSVRKVDGKWGSRTEMALTRFQRNQNIQRAGSLDQATLAALGLNASDFGMSNDAGPGTTGAGTSNRTRQPQNNPSQNNQRNQSNPQ
jgi:peptidoglycan hydrolase-like protein with peptidoglycan-binding domain